MSTWYGYVCLSHDPYVEQDRMYHGHRGEEFLIWSLKTRRGQDAGPRPSDLDAQSTNAWLDEHPNCNVGVKNGYGEMVYQYWTGNPKPLKQGGPVRTGEPVRVMSHGERGPEVTVYGEGTRVTPKGEPHAVRQNDLVAALKRVAESFPLHTETNRVLALLARALLNPPDAPSTAFKAVPAVSRGSKLCPYEILDPYTRCVLNRGHYGVGDQKGVHVNADGTVFL